MFYNIEETVMIDIKEILSLAKDKSEEGRGRLDQALGDVLSKDEVKTRSEKVDAARTIKTLLNRATVDIRTLLAERLNVEKDMPIQLMIALATDEEIDVAKPILAKAKSFKDEDWGIVIDETGSDHWCEIANRDDLSTPTLTKLLDKEDEKTAVRIVENQKLTLQPVLMSMLKRLAFRVETLHVPLLNRHEITPEMATEIYWSASESLRAAIVEKYDVSPSFLDEAMESVVQELVNAAHGKNDITDDLQMMAQRYAERKEITPSMMTKVLRRGQIAFFIALLSEYTDLNIALTKQVVAKKEGDLLAILCRATSIMKADFATYYLLTRPAFNPEQRGQGELASALSIYDRLTREKAKTIMQQWVK
ncbi:MAG: hypothetical protein CMP22_01445 [Rickettsiales bacterium]|nr:hypothetical protein [Rickettsiales bacterium]